MMFFLIKNITRYGLNLRWTHSSAKVSGLPAKAELAYCLMNPFGRSTFQIAHNVVQAICRSQAHQDMDVIAIPPMATGTPPIFLAMPAVGVKIVTPVLGD